MAWGWAAWPTCSSLRWAADGPGLKTPGRRVIAAGSISSPSRGAHDALQLGPWDADNTPMTSFGGPRPVPRSAVLMAAAVSCVVVFAAVVGALSAPVVVGALGAAVLGAVLSARSQRPAEPRLLAPLPMGTATIIAPRAGELAATGSAVHNDAA